MGGGVWTRGPSAYILSPFGLVGLSQDSTEP